MPYTELNLPKFEFSIRAFRQKKQIFDCLRKRFVLLTPEEWVRQHFIRFLIEVKTYPASLMSIEKGVKIVSGTKRTDLVIYDLHGKPWMIVECKAPHIHISKDTLMQAARYNITHQAPYLVLTNGIEHYCCDLSQPQIQFLDSLPDFKKNKPVI
ncbi:MAG: type I restriction enzyme HsdR N-terminal domain-containing protein [Bacteroidia bacterium]|nr:type I restriction enzyme HsdR N-terminal domain-containing protein [Bacteroidia bacterium]MCZ2278048.1 type I restriction enzyme HsdR N-terminal domain-containing protein [Bacteroidia bacterium]